MNEVDSLLNQIAAHYEANENTPGAALVVIIQSTRTSIEILEKKIRLLELSVDKLVKFDEGFTKLDLIYKDQFDILIKRLRILEGFNDKDEL